MRIKINRYKQFLIGSRSHTKWFFYCTRCNHYCPKYYLNKEETLEAEIMHMDRCKSKFTALESAEVTERILQQDLDIHPS